MSVPGKWEAHQNLNPKRKKDVEPAAVLDLIPPKGEPVKEESPSEETPYEGLTISQYTSQETDEEIPEVRKGGRKPKRDSE